MSDCSNHKKDLFGQTDMKVVAEAIGDLHYETLAEFLDQLFSKISYNGVTDIKGGRKELGSQLMDAGLSIHDAAVYIRRAWKISKPFMKKDAPPLEFGQVWKHKSGNKKVVAAYNIKQVKENPDDWEYVCEEAHQDGDFSYVCSLPHCRCSD